jgi:glycosyltransferase involved in cell wall biosynthesis
MTKISVIIPVYNEEKDIAKCLSSLGEQNLKDFEVILVDDGSTDQTLEIIKQEKKLDLTVFKQNHKGPGAARNLAASKAKGEILVFVDADMTFEKNFLRLLIRPILSGKAKGTFSKYEYVANWDNVWARCWNINENWEPKRRHPKNYPDTQPVFRAILKKEFESVGGFTPGGYNDDWSLSKKLGFAAVSAPGAIFYHQNPGSLHEIFFHAKWVGKRPYKLGLIGALVALFRSFILFSIAVGVVKSIFNKTPPFFLFKILYDAGVSIGIVSMLFSHRMAK